MNEKIKQLWWDIQHYGEILNKIDKSDYDNFYTERTHRYKDEIYKSIMLNGELIALLKFFNYDICSYTDGKRLFEREYWLPVGLEIVDTLGERGDSNANKENTKR